MMRKLILLIILMAAAFMAGRFFNNIKKWYLGLKINLNATVLIVIAVVCLLLGVIVGKGANLVSKVRKKVSQAIRTSIPTPAAQQASEVLFLSNFESGNDFKKWEERESVIEQSDKYNTEGRYSAKVTFFGGVNCSNVLIEDYLEENPKEGNWSGFNQLKFDIYNASESTERLDLKIKDASERAWQRTMHLAPGKKTEVTVYLEQMRQLINPARIIQFNLFRWQPGADALFYIDNLRLIPATVEAKSIKSSKETVKTKIAQGNRPAAGSDKFIFEGQNSNFGIGVESSCVKVFLEPDKFLGQAKDRLDISLARNEYESAQLVIYARESLEQVSVAKSDLVANINGRRATITSDNIKCYHVGYVKTRKPGYSVPYVGWWPDPLEEKKVFHINRNSLQPIWVEVYAPEDALAGEYSGKITLRLGSEQMKEVDLKVKVWDFSLPKRTNLKTAFDLYDNRLMRMYPQKANEDQEQYQSRIAQLMTQYYLDMIAHRIMPIFNFEIEDAFFARDIKPYLNNGLSAFAIGKYSGSANNNWPKDPVQLKELIGVYRDYASILKAAHLIDMAYIYSYDEPQFGEPHVDEVTQMIHAADPQLKNMVCINSLANPDSYPGWGDDIDIWCIRNVTFNERLVEKFKRAGKEIWLYVSGPNPPYPTLVIDYPALAYRIIPWMCWKYGLKGYLYWCVNFWDENPWLNPMNTKWAQNGNGLLYYPGEKGPISSIRLELTRDGIEDYEYLYLLAQKLDEAKDLERKNQALFERAKQLLEIDNEIVSSMSEYARTPEPVFTRRGLIAETIEQINRLQALENSIQQANSYNYNQIEEDFSRPIQATDGKPFGKLGQLTFELYRGGTFIVDGKSQFAWQRSDSYRDSAIIRSTEPLPKTYKISAVVGEIDYGLSKIEGLRPDTAYEEGPLDENGCYLLAITDEAPGEHYTNDWWHQHRKVCIDVDNNSWGTGMPYPVFMVYFDRNNNLVAYNGRAQRWQGKWDKAISYEPDSWYRVEIEKTKEEYILSIYDAQRSLLQSAAAPLNNVWHEGENYPDYLVIGEPHENYYQGSMKIKSISIPAEANEKRYSNISLPLY